MSRKTIMRVLISVSDSVWGARPVRGPLPHISPHHDTPYRATVQRLCSHPAALTLQPLCGAVAFAVDAALQATSTNSACGSSWFMHATLRRAFMHIQPTPVAAAECLLMQACIWEVWRGVHVLWAPLIAQQTAICRAAFAASSVSFILLAFSKCLFWFDPMILKLNKQKQKRESLWKKRPSHNTRRHIESNGKNRTEFVFWIFQVLVLCSFNFQSNQTLFIKILFHALSRKI